MEQAITRGRRTGWSDDESRLLWETADEAQQQGLPLKAVFERIAEKTGRRPNSIRNYYYAQVQKREGGAQRPARFVPFTQQEAVSYTHLGKSHICIPPCANILRNRNANKPSAGNSRDGKTCESRAAR